MKSFFILILAIYAVAGANGSFLDSIRKRIELELEEVVKPLMEGSSGLQKLTASMRNEVMKKAAEGGVGMDLEACANLTLSLLDAEQMAKEMIKESTSLVQNVTNAISNLLNCPSFNPIKAVTCLMDNLKAIKEDVNAAKPMINHFKQEIQDMYITIHAEFLQCIGYESVFKDLKWL